MSKTQSYYCMPQRSNLINLNDISKFKTNSKLYMRKELEWNIFDVSYIMWKKLFGYKKKAFTPLKTTKNQRYSFHLIILENLRKINIRSVSSDWAPPLSLSSEDVLSFRFRIWWSSLSKPLSTTVLVKPLSQRHLGHFCCNPCIPPYHSLTHFWQPI